jgi:hypothetical protein
MAIALFHRQLDLLSSPLEEAWVVVNGGANGIAAAPRSR